MVELVKEFRALYETEMFFSIQKEPVLVSVLSQMIPLETRIYLKFILIAFFRVYIGLSFGLIHLIFLTQIMYAFIMSIRAAITRDTQYHEVLNMIHKVMFIVNDL